MKSLNQYLNEGLIADIILKVLDASLGWIGSSAKFLADTMVGAGKELWDTTKNVSSDIWNDIRERGGYKEKYRDKPEPKDNKELSEMISKAFLAEKDPDKRIKEINEHFKDKINKGDEAIDTLYYEIMMYAQFETLITESSSKKQKKDAVEKLNAIKKYCPKLKNIIENKLNELSSK